MNCIVKPGYFLSFFFALDLVSAFSLLPDVPWIWNPMIGLQSGDSSAGSQSNSQDASFEIDRIRAVSRTGKRLLQVLKFVKLIRLGRIAKLFEMAQRTMEERARTKRRLARTDDNTIHAQDYTETSQVGSALSEQTTRKVVLLVLLMMCGIPLLQPTTEEMAEGYMVGQINSMASNPAVLGEVSVRVETNGDWTAIPANATNATISAGYQVLLISGDDLASMLVSYDPNKGQPLANGDRSLTRAPDFNESYIHTVVAPANYSVALAALTKSRDTLQQQFEWCIGYFTETILYLHVRGSYFSNDYTLPELFGLRTNEMKAAEDGTGGGGKSFGIFSIRAEARQAAEYSMWRTMTVLILLTLGALAFNHNNQRMVIEPIERMVATIVQLQKNPLAKAVLEGDQEEELMAQAAAQAKADKEKGVTTAAAGGGSSGSGGTTNETGMLERTLQKLTGLLQVGFGEAGSRMIQKCMNQNADGDLDPLVDGTRMLAIFGFCDIRRFTDATECLREDVMMYVNEIASIVHSHVSTLDGHPNKNVGDAFLVIWRLKPHNANLDPDDLFQINEKQPVYLRDTIEARAKRAKLASQAEREYADHIAAQAAHKGLLERAKQASASLPPITRILTPLVLAQLSVQADKAVVSFLRIIVDLDASTELRTYENHPRIKAAFGDDFLVQLGFGLHCGWAIEGPIGSRYKIDASYLSPHVNLSEALQDLTKLYATPLLVSGEFYTLLSPYLKSFMRRVDVVKVVGRDVPMNLYAFDIRAEAMRTIIARQTPEQYDTEADIDVLELKPSYFSKHRPIDVTSPTGRGIDTSSDPMDSPLSPGPVRHVDDPLANHALFKNPYLNPHMTDFSQFEYSGEERRRIHLQGPIATYHLVYNYRLSVLQCGIPYAFQDVYAAGLELYLEGQWPQAKLKMLEAQSLYPEDGPTKVILDTMQEHADKDGNAPRDWPGWHEA